MLGRPAGDDFPCAVDFLKQTLTDQSHISLARNRCICLERALAEGQSLKIHGFKQFQFGSVSSFMSCTELRETCANLISVSWSWNCVKSTRHFTDLGPLRPDTLRPGEGVWPQEGDGPVASGASAESSGGMRNEECDEFKEKTPEAWGS